MKLSPLFFVFSTVVGTVSIAAEPCLGKDGYGIYDMPACDFFADSGKGHGECCDSIYRNSLGRDDDDIAEGGVECYDVNHSCDKGQGDCYPGLICADSTCTLPTDNPEAHAACRGCDVALVTWSSTTGTITKGGPAFVMVVVSLLGAAAMIALQVVQRRHRVLLRRHQYSEVEATATRMDVGWTGK